MSDSVKSTLKKMVKPKRPAAPIQYQFLSTKMLALSSIDTPSLFGAPLWSYKHEHKHFVNKNIYL
jgi:hypothetical protein